MFSFELISSSCSIRFGGGEGWRGGAGEMKRAAEGAARACGVCDPNGSPGHKDRSNLKPVDQKKHLNQNRG